MLTGKQFSKINLAGRTCCKDALLHHATSNILSKGIKAFIGLEIHLDCLKNKKKPFGNSETHCKPGFKEFETLWKLLNFEETHLVSGGLDPKPFWKPVLPKLLCFIRHVFVWRVTCIYVTVFIILHHNFQSFGSRGSLENVGNRSSPPSSKSTTPKSSTTTLPELASDSPPSKSPAAASSPLLSGQRKMSSGPSISADEYMALQKKVHLCGMLIVDSFSQNKLCCGKGMGMKISNAAHTIQLILQGLFWLFKKLKRRCRKEQCWVYTYELKAF